jgi:hypothetical protein
MGSKQQRRHLRRNVRTPGLIYLGKGKPLVACVVRDVSASGVQLVLEKETDLPETFDLAISSTGKVRRKCQLVWQFSIMVGAAFSNSKPEGQPAPTPPART